MEDIHQAGQVHFTNVSPEENDLITATFRSMDLDNDGRISKSEFLELMKRDMPTNRSGSLDFDEFKTYYMLLCRSKEILAVKTEKKVKENPEAVEVKAALKAGRLFYKSLTDKNDAYNLFAVMDRNGDGNVSQTEVIDFLTDKGMPRADACKLFKGTCLGRDGYLSIEDIGALWYISVMRPYCARCKVRIMGTCYSCFECHNVSMLGYDNNTYDLCPECYNNGEFWHQHDVFFDNFFLLQMKTMLLRRRTAMSSNGGGQGTGTSCSGGGQVTEIVPKSDVLKVMADISSIVSTVCAVGSACGIM